MQKLAKILTIQNSLGLHARASAKLVKIANRFSSEIHIFKEDQRANLKSIMGLLTLAAGKGSHIKVEVEGEDAQEALDAIEEIINSKFGEE